MVEVCFSLCSEGIRFTLAGEGHEAAGSRHSRSHRQARAMAAQLTFSFNVVGAACP